MSDIEDQPSSLTRKLIVLFSAAAGLFFLWGLNSTANTHTIGMTQSRALSILSLSQNRTVVRAIHNYIKPHGYAIGAILEANPFRANDLDVVLKALEPLPQAVLVGRGYSDDETNEVRKVFAEYMKHAGINKGAVIKITSQVFEEVGKDGIPEWVLQQLKGFFE